MEAILSPNDYRLYIVLTAIAIAGLGYVWSTLSSPLAKVPGPFYSNFTGDVLKFYWLTGKRASYVHRLHKKYGPIVRIAPGEVDITDIPAVKEIHTVKATYIKDPKLYGNFAGPGQESVFSTSDIEFHRRHRRLLSSAFSENSLKTMQPIVVHRVHMTIQRMDEEMNTRGAADVFKWWQFMATDIIGELTFGESFRMLELGKKNDYSSNLEKIAVADVLRSSFPWLGLISHYVFPLPGFKDVTETVRKNQKYAEESLMRYRKLVEQDPERPIPTLFTKLFKGEEEASLTFKEILDEAQAYIVAGSETASLTMTSLVWAVCREPEIKAKLVAEVMQLPANYDDSDLQRLPYMNQVIEETLRLHAVVPSALPRLVPAGGATLAGYYLPGNATVCTQAYSLHRNEDIFPEPEKFDPSRWAKPTKEMKEGMMAFGGGSRICIGMHLGRLELRLCTAAFFRTFPDAKVSTLEGMNDGDMESLQYFIAIPKAKRCLIARS